MARKYFATYSKRSMPTKTGSPYYGDLTESMIRRMVADAPRGCDDVFEISRRTDGTFVTVGWYDMRKGKFSRATAPGRYGPGYY